MVAPPEAKRGSRPDMNSTLTIRGSLLFRPFGLFLGPVEIFDLKTG